MPAGRDVHYLLDLMGRANNFQAEINSRMEALKRPA